jgi:hypothetical protein
VTDPARPSDAPNPSFPPTTPRADAGPAADSWISPTPAPAPASLKGFLLLIGLLALLTTIAFLLLGDSWRHWFPKE